MNPIHVLKFVLLIAVALMSTACAQMGAGFHKANDENTARTDKHYDSMISVAAQNLMAQDMCYLAAAGGKMNVDGSIELTGKQGSDTHCAVLAAGLQTTTTLMVAMAPFIVTNMYARVPDSPEEILKDIVGMGFKFAITKYGIEAVTKVTNTGQLASYRLAQQSIAKHPIAITPGTILPGEGGVLTSIPGSVTTVNP
jgi:hypothetical protein